MHAPVFGTGCRPFSGTFRGYLVLLDDPDSSIGVTCNSIYFFMDPALGLEPRLTAWKAVVLNH